MERLTKSTPARRSRTAAKTQGILVLGMHRSGTSACTRMLNLLGCALTEEIYGPGAGNETGHWESIAAVNLNDEILASAGSQWDDWGPINPDWRESQISMEMTHKALAVIEDHAKLGPLFALKDPRLCRLVDVWLDAMEDAKVEPLVLTMLRNPLEVAKSLEDRDLMSPGYANLLWLRHVLDAEYLSRGQKRLFCTFDYLLANWPDMVDRIRTSFGVSFPRNSPAVHAEIDTFLKPRNRHHNLPADSVHKLHASSDWLRRTWAIMLRWSEQGEDPADHEMLDLIRHEFDQSYGTFARLLMQNGLSGEYAAASKLKSQLQKAISEAEESAAQAAAAMREAEMQLQAQADTQSALESELAKATKRMADLESELGALRDGQPVLNQQVTALEATLEERAARVTELEVELARVQARAEKAGELEARLAALTAAEADAAAEIARLREVLEQAETAAENHRARLLETEELFEANQAALDKATQQSAEYLGQLSVAQSTLAQRAEEISQMAAELQKATDTARDAEIALSQEHEQRETAQSKLVAAEQQVSDLAAKLDEERSAHAAATDKLAAEVALMAHLLREENKTLAAVQDQVGQQDAQLKAAEEARAEMESALARQLEELEQLTTALAKEGELREQATLEARLAEGAKLAAERKLAMRQDDLAKLTTLLAEESQLRQQVEAEMNAARSELAERDNAVASLSERLRQVEMRASSAEISRGEADRKLAMQQDDLAKLTTLLAEESQLRQQVEAEMNAARSELAERDNAVASLSERLRQVEMRASSAETSRAEAERKLANRFSELARLTSLLSSELQRADTAEAEREWLREVARVSRGFPKWWSLMPKGWRRKHEYARYRRHDLFDPEEYFARNSDVAQSGMDALTHYIFHGLEEGRSWR